MAGMLDRVRASALMAANGLDALLLTDLDSIRYAAGAHPGIAANWRRGIAAAVLVPADAGAPMAAVVGDLQAKAFSAASGIDDLRAHPIWVDTAAIAEGTGSLDTIAAGQAGRGPAFRRPGTFDQTIVLGELRGLLADRGLSRARIGIERDILPVVDHEALTAALPDTRFGDGADIVRRLRMVKNATEIALLERASRLAEAGIVRLRDHLAPGLDAAALTRLFEDGVAEAAAARGVPKPDATWAYISVGPDGFGPGGPAKRGDLVKVDVGCVVGGYSSDSARTFVLGPPSTPQRELYEALRRGFDAGMAMLCPGVPLADVHARVLRSVREAGLTTYARGHFGHGLGASVWSEEWPFIAADCDVVAEPGMVLAFEAPHYVTGLGAVMIEDQLLVTARGIEPMIDLTHDLVAVKA